jgi:hypothetical protein
MRGNKSKPTEEYHEAHCQEAKANIATQNGRIHLDASTNPQGKENAVQARNPFRNHKGVKISNLNSIPMFLTLDSNTHLLKTTMLL